MMKPVSIFFLLMTTMVTFAQHTPPEALQDLADYEQVMARPFQPLTNPEFVSADEASIPDTAVVFGITDGTVAKAYALNFIAKVSVVNDFLGDQPVAVSFCPLTNDGAVYSRMIDGQERFLASSGGLYKVALVMLDPASESYWSFVDGAGLGGNLDQTSLQKVAHSEKTTWAEWRRKHPETRVWSVKGETYVQGNPYMGYLRSPQPGRPVEDIDDEMPIKTPVYGVVLDGNAYHMADRGVIGGWSGKAGKHRIFLHRSENDHLGQETRAYLLEYDGEAIKVKEKNGSWRDKTHGTFDPYTGKFDSGLVLEPLEGLHTFWYIWSQYHPRTKFLGRRIGFSEFQEPRGASERFPLEIQ